MSDNDWEANYNHRDWDKDLDDFDKLPNIIDTYGGGPSGGYMLKNNKLYSWHQEWFKEKKLTLQNGYILIRKIDGCPKNSYYYEVKLVDEVPENLDKGIVVWK